MTSNDNIIYIQNEALNTAETVALSSPQITDYPEPCKKNSKGMWLVQNGKHVDLVQNETPWYLNINNIDALQTYPEIHFPEEVSFHSSQTSVNIKNNKKDTIKKKENVSNLDDVNITSQYLPYTLMYLLIFFAILLLIYKLGTINVL